MREAKEQKRKNRTIFNSAVKSAKHARKQAVLRRQFGCPASGRQGRIPFDLVYLGPPFKSQQDYNVLFAEKDGTRTRYGCEFKTQTIQNILERVTE